MENEILIRATLEARFYSSFTVCQNAGSDALKLSEDIWCVWGQESSTRLRARHGKKKLLLFGVTDGDIAQWGLTSCKPLLEDAGDCRPCSLKDHHTESSAVIRYAGHRLVEGVAKCLRVRPFCRFDFADEWNNLGFGRIRTDGAVWGVQRRGVRVDGATELAGIYVAGQDGGSLYAGSYMALLDTPDMSVLWCARPVGPIDSTEWTIVERFISDWRAEEDFPCLPCMQQVPAGHSAIVTMRLDCDEDINSARDVFEWYASERLPFSLAVKTGLQMCSEDLTMLRDVHSYGGTLLSHSHMHPYNWGETAEDALTEACASRQWFRENLPHVPVPDYAVSPFHSNPPYAMQALEEAGFKGVVCGIIHNDPEYLIGHAGRIPFTTGQLVSISQQVMLHGDCYSQQDETVDVYVQAFEAQYAANGIFGYLDHPFSKRYQYGWRDKQQRLEAHKKLVAALRTYRSVLFWNQQQCFEWVRALTAIRLDASSSTVLATQVPQALPLRPAARYQGKIIEL